MNFNQDTPEGTIHESDAYLLTSDALALQKSVISDPSTVPVSADLVAQIVAQYRCQRLAAEGDLMTGNFTAGSVTEFEEGGSELHTNGYLQHDLLPVPERSHKFESDYEITGHSGQVVTEGGNEYDVAASVATMASAADLPATLITQEYLPIEGLSMSVSRDDYYCILRENAHLQGCAEALAQEAAEAAHDRARLQAELSGLQAQLRFAQQQLGNHALVSSFRNPSVEAAAEGPRRMQQQMDAARASEALQLLAVEKAALEVRRLTDELLAERAISERLREAVDVASNEVAAGSALVDSLQSLLTAARADAVRLAEALHLSEEEARRAEQSLIDVAEARDWYQQQLHTTQAARAALHAEVSKIQSQGAIQSDLVERLRGETARLKHDLTATQQRALTEKQLLVRRLETIEADILEREADGGSNESALHAATASTATQNSELKGDSAQLSISEAAMMELQDELQRARYAITTARDETEALEVQRVELSRHLDQAREGLSCREHDVERLQEQHAELNLRLKALQKERLHQDALLLKARQDKNSAEVALQSTLDEKTAFGLAVETLKTNMAKVEANFKHLRHELAEKSQAWEALQADKKNLQIVLDEVSASHDLLQEALNKALSGKSKLKSTLQTAQKNMSAKEREFESMQCGMQEALLALQIDNKKLQEAAEAVPAEITAARLCQPFAVAADDTKPSCNDVTPALAIHPDQDGSHDQDGSGDQDGSLAAFGVTPLATVRDGEIKQQLLTCPAVDGHGLLRVHDAPVASSSGIGGSGGAHSGGDESWATAVDEVDPDTARLDMLQKHLETALQREQQALYERSLFEQHCLAFHARVVQLECAVEELAAAKLEAESQLEVVTSCKAELEGELQKTSASKAEVERQFQLALSEKTAAGVPNVERAALDSSGDTSWLLEDQKVQMAQLSRALQSVKDDAQETRIQYQAAMVLLNEQLNEALTSRDRALNELMNSSPSSAGKLSPTHSTTKEQHLLVESCMQLPLGQLEGHETPKDELEQRPSERQLSIMNELEVKVKEANQEVAAMARALCESSAIAEEYKARVSLLEELVKQEAEGSQEGVTDKVIQPENAESIGEAAGQHSMQAQYLDAGRKSEVLKVHGRLVAEAAADVGVVKSAERLTPSTAYSQTPFLHGSLVLPATLSRLHNLGSCTASVHAEMAALQQQMGAHALAVRLSSQSWRAVEDEIKDLRRIVQRNLEPQLQGQEQSRH